MGSSTTAGTVAAEGSFLGIVNSHYVPSAKSSMMDDILEDISERFGEQYLSDVVGVLLDPKYSNETVRKSLLDLDYEPPTKAPIGRYRAKLAECVRLSIESTGESA